MNYEVAWEQLKKNTTDDLAKFEKCDNYLNANICRMILNSMSKIENSLTIVEPDTRSSAEISGSDASAG